VLFEHFPLLKNRVIEEDNCKILVDKESVEFIKGSTIDFYEELIRSGFRVINNPNSEQACSCGSSFSPKI
jgi:iron-sulfur cluster assembly accessory protein